ncbi:MAG: DegV family EDD domain-containing protein [Lachnospiraceae bacterium]|nr:DegV family EDD domain-containing protein [Lachnospiraceae bacterium]
MFEKFIHLFTGRNHELRERMFRTIVVYGGLAAVIGTVESIFVKKINNMLPAFLLLLVAMGIALVTTFRYRKYNMAATILFFLIIAVMFPCLFFFGGGAHGAAPVWLALGILYAFLMFNGKKTFFYVTLCVLLDGACYLLAYLYPELVTEMVSSEMLHIDSFFGVTVVGMVSGLITKTHMYVYEEEHRLNIEQREALERSQDSKNLFFANMSHEIRTPINTIIGLNEMILRESENEGIRAYARDIQLASNLLLGQVNDILDLSQMEMDKMKLVPVSYRTEELFSELFDLTRVRMERKGLAFSMDIDPGLPTGLCGDVRRIKQVLLNLLDNAWKYTEEGSVILSASGERQEEELRLKVSVEDSGIGIRKEDMDQIYDAYNRFDEGKNSRILGSGLGLAITKQLVDLMDGEITVDSIYTKGSTFTVILRQKIEDGTPIGEVELQKETAGEGESYRPCFEAPEARILVVDDNSMNARVACSLLSATKVKLDVANSGKECLEMTKVHFYHVILLDYMMPGMNGAEILAAIRKQENGLCQSSAVIVLTANAVASAQLMYQSQGFDGFVEKPIIGRALEKEVLKQLPKDIIEYEEGDAEEKETERQIQKVAVKKRKKVYITADCLCDVPEEYLEKYDIRLLYAYIQTPNGRFKDVQEIDSASLKRYMSMNNTTALASSVTVEECEEFFAEVLTQAEKVVHISVASQIGKMHRMAKTAAKSFDHVTVIDSGQLSCGEGLVVLHAAKLAAEGMEAEDICAEIEKMKTGIRARFLLPGAKVFHQSGNMRSFFVNLCEIFGLHPMAVTKQKRIVPMALLGGTLENAWKNMIRWHLRDKKRINPEIIFITHADCSVKELEMVINEVKKRVPFKRVIVQKTSFTIACSSGLKSVGIAYYYMENKQSKELFML